MFSVGIIVVEDSEGDVSEGFVDNLILVILRFYKDDNSRF